MKFNFRKIASVIASAVMLGSTVGVAAAATYPAPFTPSGDVALVVGASGSASDWAAAVSLKDDLTPRVTTTPATVEGGWQIKTGTNVLNVGEDISSVKEKITDTQLETLLASGKFQAAQTVDYDQKLEFASPLNVSFFEDNDNNDVPSVGLHLANNQRVLNYTLTFASDAKSDVVSNRLDDFETKTLTILGKEYIVLNAYNDTKQLELMAGAATDTLNLNEEKDIVVNGKTYKVKLTFIDADSAKFDIDGKSTGDLSKGSTTELADGTQFGVRDLSYQAFAGGVMAASISLGAEKMTLQNGQAVELNDEEVDGLTGYLTFGTSGSQVTWKSLVIEWNTDDEKFVTANQSLVMQGFESVQLQYTGLNLPASESVKVVNDGSRGVKLTLPIEDGEASITLLSGNGTSFNKIGKTGSSDALVTSSTSKLVYDADTDEYFVASWNNTKEAESYLLSAKTSRENSVNKTTITNEVTGATTTVEAGDDVSFGGIDLFTVNTIDYAKKEVNVTALSGVTFNQIFSKEGLRIVLPVNGLSGNGFINLTLIPETYSIKMYEEDKDGNLGAGTQFNATLGWSDDKTQVTDAPTTFLGGSAVTDFEVSDNTYVAYVNSQLATKIDYDQEGTQDTVEFTYHGGEVSANVFVAPTGAATTSSGAISVVYDNAASTVSGKNLIVIGGSCVNTVARQILAPSATAPVCGADFTSLTGVNAGQYLIKSVQSPLNTAKTAVLVAGYEAADTTSAAQYLKTENVTTDSGASQVYPIVG